MKYVQQGSDTCKVRHSRLPARAGWCRWPCERLEVVEEEVKYVQQGSDTCKVDIHGYQRGLGGAGGRVSGWRWWRRR